jgi:hypothetical protein
VRPSKFRSSIPSVLSLSLRRLGRCSGDASMAVSDCRKISGGVACASLLASAILQAGWPICAALRLGSSRRGSIPIIGWGHRLIAIGDGVSA